MLYYDIRFYISLFLIICLEVHHSFHALAFQNKLIVFGFKMYYVSPKFNQTLNQTTFDIFIVNHWYFYFCIIFIYIVNRKCEYVSYSDIIVYKIVLGISVKVEDSKTFRVFSGWPNTDTFSIVHVLDFLY